MKNNVTISPPLFVLGTGVAGGATFVTVAVASAEMLGTPPSLNLIVGASFISIVGGLVMLAFKGWAEKQFKKFLETPSKEELEAKHKAVIDAIAALVQEVRTFKDTVSDDHHKLDIRVSDIETRHDTEDRLAKMRFGSGNTGGIPRS